VSCLEKSKEIYKKNIDFSSFSEIFRKFDENLGERSFSSVKKMLRSKDFSQETNLKFKVIYQMKMKKKQSNW
jgi:hypothetical protein